MSPSSSASSNSVAFSSLYRAVASPVLVRVFCSRSYSAHAVASCLAISALSSGVEAASNCFCSISALASARDFSESTAPWLPPAEEIVPIDLPSPDSPPYSSSAKGTVLSKSWSLLPCSSSKVVRAVIAVRSVFLYRYAKSCGVIPFGNSLNSVALKATSNKRVLKGRAESSVPAAASSFSILSTPLVITSAGSVGLAAFMRASRRGCVVTLVTNCPSAFLN